MQPIRPALHRRDAGGILVTTLLLVALMSMMTAATLYRVGSRYSSTYQSMCWNEALNSAEGGADLAIVALNKSLTSPNTAWAGWTPSDATTFPKTYAPPIPDHAGDGNTKVYAKVTVDTGVGGGWMRVRSVGVAELPKRTANGLEAVPTDINGVKNHRNGIRKPRFTNDITNGVLRLPQIVRTIECLAAPAANYPYLRPLTVKGSITLTGGAWTDSFNSTDPLYSTNGKYDFAKHLNHGDLASNASGNLSDLQNNAVYGSVTSNGGVIQRTGGVTGTVTNNFKTTFASISSPVFSSLEASPSTVTGSATLVGGTQSNPKNYILNQIKMSNSETLVFDTPTPGTEAWINVRVTGNVQLTGYATIEQKAGVHVNFYVEGDAKIAGNGYLNRNTDASYLQFFGVTASNGSTGTLQISGNGDFSAVVNAPSYNVTITGNGSLCGTVIGNSATLVGNGGYHYDESLKLLPAPGASNYQFVSWMEDIR